MARPATNLEGKIFGRLRVLSRAENSAAGAARWTVACSCGTTKQVRSSQLTDGNTQSCGCLARENAATRTRTHGRTNTFEYRAWLSMRRRCEDPAHPAYGRYGGAGIRVCHRWKKFEHFFEDMGECPFPNGSVERKDNRKGYSPSNCCWLQKARQAKNRTNVPLYAGLTLPELAAKHGIKYSTLRQRIAAGWHKDLWFKTPQELGTRN